MSATAPLLEVENVETFYGSIQALKGISLEVYDGEIVTLIGANGAGKSTTLRSINGLNHLRRGPIRFGGDDITNDPPHEIVKRGIAQSPEGRKLFPRMSVTENLEKDKILARMRPEMDLRFTYTLGSGPRLVRRRMSIMGGGLHTP